MFQLSGYKIFEEIYNCERSRVVRATELANQRKVIIKASAKDFLTEKEMNDFKQEFNLGSQISSPNVVKYLEIKNFPPRGAALIMLDDDGIDLSHFIEKEKIELNDFLDIAIQLTEGLQAIHQKKIIHQDISSHNVIWIKKLKKAQIIDFNSASTLKQISDASIDLEKKGNLAYISPEQTGRVNRLVDFRTDFYSLGVLLYQIATGSLPFPTKDLMELIYAHIARTPSPPHQLNPNVPVIISGIILKLMAKNPEDRYQSCHGLHEDLVQCQSQFKTQQKINSFPLAQFDFPEQFQLAQDLFGREQEVNILMDAIKQVSFGQPQMIAIAGSPGVGKTTLINEMQKPIALAKGYFIKGKFDSLQTNIAYSALIQAFQGLVKQLLTEPEEQIKFWKKMILARLKENTQILIDLVPELECIVGKQNPLPELHGNEAEKRFHFAVKNFIQVFCEKDHLLVLFLDDIQWASSAVFDLIQFLVNADISYFMLIIAYRNIELSQTQQKQLKLIFDGTSKSNVSLKNLNLNALSIDDINRWLIASFKKTAYSSLDLATIIYQKTQGNPFFVKSFIQLLYEENLLSLSFEKGWIWQLDKILSHPVTDNVVNFLIERLSYLPSKALDILKFASFLGYQMETHALALMFDMNSDQLLEALTLVLNNNLMTKQNSNLMFTHDRIREACYNLFSESEKEKTHLFIGRVLLKNITKPIPSGSNAKIVYHFNRAAKLINDPKEKITIAQLNLEAATAAKQMVAFAIALNYINESIQSIKEINIWKIDYDFAFSLHKVMAEINYLNGLFEQSSKIIYETLPKLEKPLDKIDFYQILITQKILAGEFQASFEIGKLALELLGIKVPSENINAYIEKEFERIQKIFSQQNIDELLQQNEIKDENKKAALKILFNLYAASYIGGSELLPVYTLMMVDISLQYGNAPESCMGYAAYGMLLCTQKQEYFLGHRFGLLAVKLSEKLNNDTQKCRSLGVVTNFIHHWSKPLRSINEIIEEGINSGLSVGELQYTGYLYQVKARLLFDQGINLPLLKKELKPLLNFAEMTQNLLCRDIIVGLQMIVNNLLAETIEPKDFREKEIDNEQYELQCLSTRSSPALCFYQIMKGSVFYLYESYPEAFECLKQAEKYLKYIPGQFAVTTYYWYQSLILLALYPNAPAELQENYLRIIEENQNKIKIWMQHAPENFTHRFYLLEAEINILKNQSIEIILPLFEKAQKFSKKNSFTQEYALICEKMAQFWLKRKQKFYAKKCLEEAYLGYKKWGAKRKLDLMAKIYPKLLPHSFEKSLSAFSVGHEQEISGGSLGKLDLSSILKASQTISSENDLENLLNKIIDIMIKNVGASEGTILFHQADDLTIEAEYKSNHQIKTCLHLPLNEWESGSRVVVEYVKRTKLPVIIGNILRDNPFKEDVYLQKNQVRSLLCIPFLRKGQLKGLLYFENRLTNNAFSNEQLEVLQILATQFAISLENIQLFNWKLNQTEQALTTVSEQLEMTFQEANIGFWKLDINRQQLTWNKYVYPLFGLDVNQFPANLNGFYFLVHADDRARLKEEIKKALQEKTNLNTEFRIIWPSDKSIHVIASRGRIIQDKKDNHETMIGLCWDITLNKKLEEERFAALEKAKQIEVKRAEDAEVYQRLQEEFTSTICHELRNPLNSIYGSVDLLLQLVNSLPSSEVFKTIKEYGEIILQSAMLQKVLVDDVLDLSKIQKNKIELLCEPFNLNQVLKSITFLFKPQLTQKKLKLLSELDKTDIWIKGDKYRLTQIISNLLSNAIKFTPEEGKIILEATLQSQTDQITTVGFKVEDTGIGMSQEEQKFLFESFRQAHSKISIQYGGSGLGLVISQKFVQLMGGEIKLKSEKYQGSCFSFSIQFKNLTLEEKKFYEKGAEINLSNSTSFFSPEKNINRNLNILVAEDNAFNQRILKSHLEQAGYSYQIANNGQEAVELFKKFKFDLVLMDIEMPILNGLEATTLIRKEEDKLQQKKIPIIGLSGNAMKEQIQLAKDRGMSGYLTKPYRREDLYKEIDMQIQSFPIGKPTV